jgi:2-polyprenyl-3-methyl-5-hydroxy-6-metoxy-1,4-benzoquinol methylase
MTKRYSEPDRSVWSEDDPRKTMDFDLGFNILEKPLAEAVMAVGGYALDIGCGNGRFLVTLAKLGYIRGGLGIDISDAMVDNARKSAENNGVRLRFDRNPVEQIDIWPPVDAIIATEILEHIYYLRTGIDRMASWLRRDGVFVGTVPLERTCDAVVHLHYFTRDSLYGLLSDYFGNVWVKTIDVTGEGENHLAFICYEPKKD